MNETPSNAEATITALAAEWVVRRDAGLSAPEAAELAAWCAADPRHEAALQRFSAVWRQVDRPRATGAAEAVHAGLQRRARQRRRRRLAAAGAVAALALAATLGLKFRTGATGSPTATVARAQTTLLGPERRALPDGSVAEFPRGTEIAVDFSGTFRRIALPAGEAHFQVAHDPGRPFIVTAGGIAVRAVGTGFAVRVAAEETSVVVTEGRVAVHPVSGATPGPALAQVGAGESVAVTRIDAPTSPAIVALSTAELARQLSWRRQRAEFSAVPLADVIATVNRHSRLQFVIADATLATTPLSGVFFLDDAEEFAQLLERGFGLVVERSGPDRFLLRGKR